MSIGVSVMAKKKPKASKPEPAILVMRAFKVSPDYAAWMERFASRERVGLSSLIDRALAAHSIQTGFEPPPDRIP
jgi:hypothetical protein